MNFDRFLKRVTFRVEGDEGNDRFQQENIAA